MGRSYETAIRNQQNEYKNSRMRPVEKDDAAARSVQSWRSYFFAFLLAFFDARLP